MPPGMYLKLGSYLGLAMMVGGLGWKLRDGDYQRHLRKDAQTVVIDLERVRAQESEREAIAQLVREALAKDQLRIATVTNTIREKVPYYVTQTPQEERIRADGGLPLGFVWAYNGAASLSSAPLPAGTDPGTPSGVDLSTLTGVTLRNFELCHSERAELARWHDWYNQLAPSFKTPTKP